MKGDVDWGAVRAITIRQPWADAVVDGHKPVENRVYAALCEWAEGLRIEVEAERAIERRSRLVSTDGPRSVPSPVVAFRRGRDVGLYDWDGEGA